jgi:hypothetical protein
VPVEKVSVVFSRKTMMSDPPPSDKNDDSAMTKRGTTTAPAETSNVAMLHSLRTNNTGSPHHVPEEPIGETTDRHQACSSGRSLDDIRAALRKNPSAISVQQDENGKLPLLHYYLAVTHHNVSVVISLRTMSDPSNKNHDSAMTKSGTTTASTGTETSNVAMLHSLKTNDTFGSPNVPEEPIRETTDLHRACSSGRSLDDIRAALRKIPTAISVQDKYGKLPLHYFLAVTHHNVSIVISLRMMSDPSNKNDDSAMTKRGTTVSTETSNVGMLHSLRTNDTYW